jgi:anti-anti-sigma factor
MSRRPEDIEGHNKSLDAWTERSVGCTNGYPAVFSSAGPASAEAPPWRVILSASMNSARIRVRRSGAVSSPRLTSQLGGAPRALRATTQRNGRAVIITVGGEVDASNEGDWNYLLAQIAATATPPGSVVVDVSGLDFMGSCAYAALARQAERCRRRGVTLCLVSTQPIVARTVAACGLRWRLPIHPTIETALSRAGSFPCG